MILSKFGGSLAIGIIGAGVLLIMIGIFMFLSPDYLVEGK